MRSIYTAFLSLKKSFNYTDPDSGSEILFLPSDEFKISVVLDYGDSVLGTQYAELRNINDYKSEIASCKTFVLLTELENLAKSNLIKGGNLENAIVMVDRKNIKVSELKEH